MIRRFTPLLLLGLLIFVLAACGGTATPDTLVAEVDLGSLPIDLSVSEVEALRDNPNVVIIDVREQYEYDEGHIPNANLIPLGTIPNSLNQIPTGKTVVAVCRSGNRSSQATEFLRGQGFNNVHNMTGGMNDWAASGYEIAK